MSSKCLKIDEVKSLVKRFCKFRGYDVKVFINYSYNEGMRYCLRIRFGKYMLKFHQTGYFLNEESAWLHALIMIANDLFETNFNGWKTFGPIGISRFEEKVTKIK